MTIHTWNARIVFGRFQPRNGIGSLWHSTTGFQPGYSTGRSPRWWRYGSLSIPASRTRPVAARQNPSRTTLYARGFTVTYGEAARLTPAEEEE
jgi:hypothetical protein